MDRSPNGWDIGGSRKKPGARTSQETVLQSPLRRIFWTKRGPMRVVSHDDPDQRHIEPDGGLMDRIVNFARQVEARGFPGVWIGDSLGRGRPTLDSLQVLTALAAVTSRLSLGSQRPASSRSRSRQLP